MTAYVIAQTTLTDKEKYQKEFIPVPERMVILAADGIQRASARWRGLRLHRSSHLVTRRAQPLDRRSSGELAYRQF